MHNLAADDNPDCIFFASSAWLHYVVYLWCAVSRVPPVNYMRLLFSLRRHNAQLRDEVTSQMSTIFQREKKVTLNMCIVTGLLFATLLPIGSMEIFHKGYPRIHSILLPWSITMTFIPPSTNPIIYFGRNKNMRNAFKSIMKI